MSLELKLCNCGEEHGIRTPHTEYVREFYAKFQANLQIQCDYSRLLMTRHPEWADRIETRALHSP